MSRKTEQAKHEQYVAQLTARIEHIKSEASRWRDEAIAEKMKNGELMTASLEIDRLRQRQTLIDLICQGKNLEAIKFVLETKVMLFNIDVRFADDKTRLAAEDELLEKTKKTVVEAVQAVRFTRNSPIANNGESGRNPVLTSSGDAS